MREHEAIIDYQGEPITIGTLIHFPTIPASVRKTRVYGPDYSNPSLVVRTWYPAEPEAFAVVTFISDVDGDVDDEGRSIAIYPSVTIRYSDGTTEDFGTSWTGRWYDDDAPFEAGDLEVAFHGPANFNPTKEQAA